MLLTVYAVTLAVGLASLDSPDQPIGDPFFSLMEILIIALMPAMIALMAAFRAWVRPEQRLLATISLVFMGLLAMLTSALHFTILTLSRRPDFSGEPWQPFVFSFRWPSVAYALDILAWDVFFALSMLFAASAVRGGRLAGAVRTLMIAAGLLSLAGLSGVVTGNMQLRNIGIVGYVPVFLAVAVLLAVLFARDHPAPAAKEAHLELGAFSLSLSVKDLSASRSFYEKLGFTFFGGDASQNWLIMKKGEHVIGLFQGMFEGNLITFNPGWDQNANRLERFQDVRGLRRELEDRGIAIENEADETGSGPAGFVIRDPDGNAILFDQHV